MPDFEWVPFVILINRSYLFPSILWLVFDDCFILQVYPALRMSSSCLHRVTVSLNFPSSSEICLLLLIV